MKGYNGFSRFILVLIFIFLTNNPVEPALSGLPGKTEFFRMSTDWGLSNSSVTSIIQDDRGYLWFGTLNGLNRYDGFTFKIFKNIPHEPTSLRGNEITALLVDSKGTLWIGTWNSGIHIYEPGKNHFMHIEHNPGNIQGTASEQITSLLEDNNGNIWVGSDGGGVNRLDNKTKKVIQSLPGQWKGIGLSDTHIRGMIMDKDDAVLWIGTASSGLNRINLENNSIKVYRLSEGDPYSLSNDRVSSLLVDSSGILWVGTDGGGLNRYDKERDRFVRIESTNPGSGLKIGKRITALFQDSRGVLWIGTRQEGLVCYDYKKNEISRFTHGRLDRKSLSSNRILSVFEDRSGLIWIGTDQGGFCIYDRLKSEFSLISNETHNDFNQRNGIVQAALEDMQGFLWIGTDTALEKMNPSTGEVTVILNGEQEPEIYNQYNITALYKDKNGDIWIGTKNKGLIKYQYAAGKSVFFKNDPLNPASLSHNHVSTIFRDRSGSIWIGTWGGGLELFLEKERKFKHHNHDPGNRFTLSDDAVSAILEDTDGFLWVGTSGGGLNKFDGVKRHFFTYQRQPGAADGIGSNIIHDMIEDDRGNLWIGGSGGGLTKFDKKKGTFITFSDKGYLEDDEIFNVLEDEAGNIWLGTNKRLAKFDPKNETFLYYDTYYWLDNNEIVASAAFRGKSGDLFFGGTKGISYFHPGKMSDIKEVPNLRINSLLVNDQPVYSFDYDPVNRMKFLELPYYKNKISFTFFIIDFRVPDNSRYAYKLEGNDDDWEYQGNLEYLLYEELSPGEYNFVVRGANHYGIWDNKGETIRIIISAPFWGTPWFKVFLILLFIGLILGLYKWRTHKILRQKSGLEKKVTERTVELQAKQEELVKARDFLELQVEERTKELKRKNIELENEIRERELAEAERRKLEKQLFESQKMESIGRLAGGIAHDFNNILTVIMGYADLLKLKLVDQGPKIGKSVDAVLINSHRARGLVNQLLGFARGGKYNPVPLSINKAIRRTISVSGKIFKKGTKIEYHLQKKLHSCLADRSQIDQVLTNLIINSADAMPEGGKIIFETGHVYINEKPSEKYSGIAPGLYIRFSISDTGTGIPENIMDKVFEPFFTTKGRAEGTGLGLATVYGIVKNHLGHIEIMSKPGAGTTVTILLPACEEHSREKEENSKIIPGEGSILIVDDEDGVVSVLREQLESLGYHVYSAEDGRRAIKIFKELSRQIDLVLLDMIMPNMSGKELFFELKKLNPGLKIMLISGFSKGDDALQLINHGAVGFIQKPIPLPTLSKRIFEILNQV